MQRSEIRESRKAARSAPDCAEPVIGRAFRATRWLHPGYKLGEHRPSRENSTMRRYTKIDFPIANVRRLIEPGPIVLVSSAHGNERNIMTMGWHMMMEFTPALIGCVISDGNHSFELIRGSRQCVINVPTVELATAVVRIGNTSGRDIDKFSEFALTPKPGTHVRAPLIAECYANLECVLADAGWVNKYNMFVFEVVKAHVATSPKTPKTIHYRGDGEFMMSGAETRKYRKLFRPGML
jgi:flavin reductase (DIM6/NTAB) family NADH-FMN oxidoreductase RutF